MPAPDCNLSFCMKLQKKQLYLLVFFILQATLIITLLLTHSNWRNANSTAKRMFVVDTIGCKIPNIDPFDNSVVHMVSKSKLINCNSTLPLTYTDGRFLRINRTALDLYYDDELDYCEFETIYRPEKEKSDNVFRYRRPIRFSDDLDVQSEFIRVACFGQQGSLMYTNFHAFVLRKDEVEDRCRRKYETFLQENKPKEVFNFLILGVDSISRLNFIRHLPKTRSFLINEMSAIELQGYNKVADNTYVNLVPMFAGKYVEELPWDERYSDVPFDNFTFIWNMLSDIGYRTLFAEDAPQIAIFNYNKAGFHRPPADYYLRPLSLALEDHGSMWKNDHDCVGSKLETVVVLDWIAEFEETFKNDPHLSFSFITRLTHDNLNKAQLADEPYYNFFQRLHTQGLLDNSFIIFYSDHGMRFGDIRQTYVGKMEERLPFMYLVLPKKFVTDYPQMAAATRVNANRLTTPFDIYESIVDLIAFGGLQHPNAVSSRGMTLFSEIPLERTCEHATILPHWCTCHETKEVRVDDKAVVDGANHVVQHVNNLLKIHGSKCAVLSLNSVIDARKIIPNDPMMRYLSSLHDVLGRTVRFASEQSFSEYQLAFSTNPSGGTFEATVRLSATKQNGVEIGDISRINAYGLQSDCIDFHTHKKFCYCV